MDSLSISPQKNNQWNYGNFPIFLTVIFESSRDFVVLMFNDPLMTKCMFKLADAFKEKDFIIDLALCRVLLENNAHYPWIMLIPMRENAKNMTYLPMDDRLQLMKEIAIGENVMNQLFAPDQINVAAIGNSTPLLHVHIVARKIGDPDWPKTVWYGHTIPYDLETKIALREKLREALRKEQKKLGS